MDKPFIYHITINYNQIVDKYIPTPRAYGPTPAHMFAFGAKAIEQIRR